LESERLQPLRAYDRLRSRRWARAVKRAGAFEPKLSSAE